MGVFKEPKRPTGGGQSFLREGRVVGLCWAQLKPQGPKGGCSAAVKRGLIFGPPRSSFVAYLYHTIEVWGIGGNDVGFIQSTKAAERIKDQKQGFHPRGGYGLVFLHVV